MRDFVAPDRRLSRESPIAAPPAARVGCDLVDISRIARLTRTYSWTLLRDVFSALELEGGPVELARAFAVKEATLKALGTGQARGIQLRDVEVELGLDGSATALLSGALYPIAQAYEAAAATFVDENWASAVVVLYGRGEGRCATS